MNGPLRGEQDGAMQDRAVSTHSIRSLGPRKKLVIFADGTGAAFSSQELNVWRLYQALDKREGPDGVLHLARYIPGVGTSSVRVIRALDGATGWFRPTCASCTVFCAGTGRWATRSI